MRRPYFPASILSLVLLATVVSANKAEVVASDVLPRWLSISSDTTGRPHIAFCAVDGAASPYTWRITYALKSGSWQKQVVDSSRAISHDPAGPPDVSLALDQDDNPAMCYWHNVGGDSMCYAQKSGAVWNVEAILGTYPSWPTLRFGGTIPFIIYSHYNDDSNWVFVGSAGATPTGWAWDSTGVKERINLGDRALDFVWNGTRATILYIYSSGTGYKRLVRPLGWDGDWSYGSPIDSTGSDPRESGVHMALSRNGTTGAVFAHQDNGGSGGPYALYYVTHSGSSWGSPEIVDTMLLKTADAGGLASGPALAYDTLNRPHIVYVSDGSSGNWVLTHAWKEGSTWHKEALDTLSDLYLYRNEVFVDRLNHLHVAYIAGSGSARNVYYLAPGGSGVIEEGSQYPQPNFMTAVVHSSGKVLFSLPGVAISEVRIYDSRGALVETVTIQNGAGSWLAKASPEGVYFARASSGSQGAVKIVLMK